ncbi:MAG: hypothetical protein IJ087_10075 [Eggerthellaceae bacterium]|nr:hypothetical protein [Eggerthellaceae bacterium]
MTAVMIEREEAQLFEFTIEGSKKVHRIPLAAYLPYPFMHRMLTVDGDKSFAMELLHEYCPELEEDEKLTFGTIMSIYEAWEKASKEDGATSGE